MTNRSRPFLHRRFAAATTALVVSLSACSPADDAAGTDPASATQLPPGAPGVQDVSARAVVTAAQAVQNTGPAITASRSYFPVDSAAAGHATVSRGQVFTIPARLPVVKGNAGNGLATLDVTMPRRGTFGLRDDRWICRYRGGSTKATPDDDLSRAQGRSYRFDSCFPTGPFPPSGALLREGSTISDAQLTLTVGSADPTQPQTTIQIGSSGLPTSLEPPISAEESIRIRDAFSWQKTMPLAETNTEGLPALYYGIVYLEEEAQVQALDELWMHHDFLPLFAEEQARWAGQKGVFENEGDGKGIFKFVVFPGKLYNILRDAALQNDLVFRVLQLRSIPAAARGADGSLSYAALRNAGFLYRNGDLPVDGVDAVAQPGLFSSLRKVVSAATTVVKAVVRTVGKGLGAVDRFVNGSVRLTFRLDLRNTDAAFGLGTPMQRAWGPSMGQQVTIPDLRITVRQYTLGGLLPTLFSDRTDESGVASMKVTKAKSASYCIALDNKAAQITNLVIEAALCDFDNIGSDRLGSDYTHQVTVANKRLSALAQASEGYAYLKGIVGYTPRKAKILVGPLAEAMGRATKGAAIAPCFAISNLYYDELVLAIAHTAATLAPNEIIGQAVADTIVAAAPLYAVDIIVPNDGGTTESSRGVMSHEYGHFALCNLMREQGLTDYSKALRQVVMDRLASEATGTVSNGMTVNEGFADFFAGQIAGGIDYWHDWNPSTSVVYSPGPMQFCRDDSNACLDQNFDGSTGGRDLAVRAIARAVSIFHDAFDGRSWRRGELPPATPGNANVWHRDPMNEHFLSIQMDNGRPVPGVPDAADEVIALDGHRLKDWVKRWFGRGVTFKDDDVLGGLADVMKEQGYSWCQICPLFAAHETGSGTGVAAFEACTRGPIASWIGPPPAAGAASCCNPTEISVPITGDAMVFSRPGEADKSFPNAPLLRAMAWAWSGVPGTMRGYFDVDLPPAPAGTELWSALLNLKAAYSGDPAWPGHASAPTPNDLIIRKVLGPWQPSTVTWNNQPSSSEEFVFRAAQSTSATQDYTLDFTYLVRDQLQNPASHHGYVLQLITEQKYAALSFGSSDNPDVTKRPTMWLTYLPTMCR